ncbi:MAG: hypothetical protein A4S09_09745 [Proteobacteria bacterium SG_bin7]|nr:MAG: hypothetical protein A4S09_09745 [Proteobacteria bacterium SG_bin7]
MKTLLIAILALVPHFASAKHLSILEDGDYGPLDPGLCGYRITKNLESLFIHGEVIDNPAYRNIPCSDRGKATIFQCSDINGKACYGDSVNCNMTVIDSDTITDICYRRNGSVMSSHTYKRYR